MQSYEANVLAAWSRLACDQADRAAAEATDLSERMLAGLVLGAERCLPGPAGIGVDGLGARLGLTQSGTTRLLDRLVAAGLLTRHRQPGRREVALQLTARGQSRLAQAHTARQQRMAELTAALTASEQAQLVGLITKALGAATRSRAEVDAACRLCDWAVCNPRCPLDASVVDEPAG